MSRNPENRPPVAWVVTDGRAGIEAQALGLAEAVAQRTPLLIVGKRISIGAPWRDLPHRVWGDPLARLARTSDFLSPPFPDVWIGCGRQSVALTIAVKRKSPSTFTVQIQDPRAPAALFDLVISPAHDNLSGDNIFSIIGSPVRNDANATGASVRRGRETGRQKVAVLIGGPNRAFDLAERDARAVGAELLALAKSGAELVVTTSRRTPGKLAETLKLLLEGHARVFWRAGADPASSNPYPAMLADADAIVVTEDSVNMAVEAAATGRPVHILRLPRKRFASAKKFDAFHESLRQHGASRYFTGALDGWAYAPLNETARAADEVVRRWRLGATN